MTEFQGRRRTAVRALERQPLHVVGSPPPEELRTESRPAGIEPRLMAIEARMTSIEIAIQALDHDLQELVVMTAEAVGELQDQLTTVEITPEGEPFSEADRFDVQRLASGDELEERYDELQDEDPVANWAVEEAKRLRQEAQGAGAPDVDLDVEDVPEDGVQVTPPGREPFDHLEESNGG